MKSLCLSYLIRMVQKISNYELLHIMCKQFRTRIKTIFNTICTAGKAIPSGLKLQVLVASSYPERNNNKITNMKPNGVCCSPVTLRFHLGIKDNEL